MKRILLFSSTIILLVSSILLMQSCNLDTCKDTMTYVKYNPVYIKIEDYRKAIEAKSPTDIESPGKMYFYKNYLLINEKNKGIHVIDNTNPSNPVPVTFWEIPGNIDMAIQDDVLFADNYTDLIAVDIKDIFHPAVVERRQNVFNGFQFDANNGLIVGYSKTDEVQTIDCNNVNYGKEYYYYGNAFFSSDGSVKNVGVGQTGQPNIQSPNSGNTTGIQGSQARFTISADYLYVLNNQGILTTYDIKNRLVEKSNVNTIWNAETIFAYDKALFIGAPMGLIIFDIKTPTTPKQAAVIQHVVGCDPVYVDGNKAYVTIRSGTTCNNNQNILEVFDVSNIYAPSRISQFNMDNPHGVSAEGKNLYVCEGKYGLKVFDRTDDYNIDHNKIAHFTGFHAYDVIALPENYPAANQKIVMVIGDDGLVQYDATDNTKLKPLSTIKVKN